MDLLKDDELPAGWRYPGAFLRLVNRGLTYFEPWRVLDGWQLRTRYAGLRARYPGRQLIPFARRDDCDDVACWDLSAPGDPARVFIIHDFASPGWERRAELPTFHDWVRHAVEDMLEFDPFEEPDSPATAQTE